MDLENIHSYDEALQESLEYYDGSHMEASTFLKKYALQDADGNLYEKDPDDMHKRLSSEFGRAERKYPNPTSESKLYSLLKDFEGPIPQGSPMSAIGNPFQLMSTSNCFVVLETDDDSYGNIMKTDQELAQIYKRRGGCGTDVSHLRPQGAAVDNAARESTGITTFCKRFSRTTEEVGQAGRRGALMITLDIRHPDIEEFVKLKREPGNVTGANISVRMRDEFMEAVERGDEEYVLRFPIDADPEEAKYTKTINPQELFQEIVESNYGEGDTRGGEPGVVWMDRIWEESPASHYDGYKEVSTNPCAELPLPDGDSCRLLAMNLFAYVENPFEDNARFNYDKFSEEVRHAQRMMDDIVELEIEKVNDIIRKIKRDDESEAVKGIELNLWERIKNRAVEARRTGLGTTALGDVLAALGVRYGSGRSFEIADKIYKTLKLSAYRESVKLAKERGPFPIWDHEKDKENPFLLRIKDEDPELWDEMAEYGRRNVSILTNAPTGTVSLLAQTTSGIENLYAPFHFRKRKINHDEDVEPDYVDENDTEWLEFPVFHEKFKLWMEKEGYDPESVKDRLTKADSDKARQELRDLKNESPYAGATTEDVDWVSKVKLQGKIQKHIDHSISVTVNLPEDVDKEVLNDVYMQSWKSDCKGCTLYRTGSREAVLSEESDVDKDHDGILHNDAPERPRDVECDIHQIRFRGENWKILVGFLKGDPYEIFALKTGGDTGIKVRFVDEDGKGVDEGVIRKAGSGHYKLLAKDGNEIIENITELAPSGTMRAMSRMVSLALRHGAKIDYVIEQLDKSEGSVASFNQAVLRALRHYHSNGNGGVESCPECGSEEGLVYQEACLKCKDCGWSRC